jgi:molybdopterin converting factor small subunit
MESTIKVFSILAERLGGRTLRIDLSSPIRAGDMLDELAGSHDAVAEFRTVIRLAVNHEYVDEEYEVRPGDELALITPTSGG